MEQPNSTSLPANESPICWLVDDSLEDALLLRRAWQKLALDGLLIHFENGTEAVNALRKRTASLPTLIFLDIKMPGMDGFEVLKWIHSNPGLVQIPVLIMSSSCLDTDMARAQSLGANDYLVKPASTADLILLLKATAEKWL